MHVSLSASIPPFGTVCVVELKFCLRVQRRNVTVSGS